MSEHFDSTLKERRASRTPGMLPVLLPELRGSRAAWSGVITAEPMLRGSDQRGLFDRLAAKGIRHVIVQLNGPSEDSSLFARKHVQTHPFVPKPAARGGSVGHAVYDLARRDEGAFTRLKFLLEAAHSAGVIVGLSLFDAAMGDTQGPFRKGGNFQGLSLSAIAQKQADEHLLSTLGAAGDWVCSAARGFRGVWIEIFRHAPGEPSAIERALCTRVAATLARYGEDLSPARLGPWIASRRPNLLSDKLSAQTAPFDSSREIRAEAAGGDFANALWQAETDAGTSDAEFLFKRAPQRQPALLRMGEGVLDAARANWLWRAFFRGYWPAAALRVNESRDARLLDTIAAIARFGVAWAGRGALRPCPELLEPMVEEGSSNETVAPGSTSFSAEDGAGRYFAYFDNPALHGLALALPPGFYRYYWIDPAEGRIVDRGEGVEGMSKTHIPGCADPVAKLLVIENDESPDTLSVW